MLAPNVYSLLTTVARRWRLIFRRKEDREGESLDVPNERAGLGAVPVALLVLGLGLVAAGLFLPLGRPADTVRSFGVALSTSSAFALFVTNRVQNALARRITKNAFSFMSGRDAPQAYLEELLKYCISIDRVTTLRQWDFEFAWEDPASKNILRLDVKCEATGSAIAHRPFRFQRLHAPQPLQPGRKTYFKGVQIGVNRRGHELIPPKEVRLAGKNLEEYVFNDADGRVFVDLTRVPDNPVLHKGDSYTILQSMRLSVPIFSVYVMEAYGAHMKQVIRVHGPAVKDLQIDLLHGNQYRPRPPVDLDKDEIDSRGFPVTRWVIEEVTFPGQPAVLDWRPSKELIAQMGRSSRQALNEAVREPRAPAAPVQAARNYGEIHPLH